VAGGVRLQKELKLFDVYAISTGAMFSSGFFLLPGLAAAQAGPSVVLAYLAAAVFIIPAMFSVAELSTAMPRSGGAYYFLDRALGPLAGTVGGFGSWVALVLKSAFALVGMGAYLALYIDLPITPLAIGLTVGFGALNVYGAKETTGLQRLLVGALLGILAFFVVQGVAEVTTLSGADLRERYQPLFAFGLPGFLSTIGLVFVSYAGLTKVASVAEEVENPQRNLPLGMALSLATATFIYVVGVAIIVAVLDPEALRSDLTPVATAAAAFFDWLPGGLGVGLIVVAAVAAFASTGNAGIMAASRYPFAMARDNLVWERWSRIGRFGTPTEAVLVTAGVMALAILTLDVEAIAKLASAFQLLLFAALCLAVIVMRESGIEAYDPGFRSPFYPWLQILGMAAPLWLITEMGELAVLFTLGLVAFGVGWYFYYVRGRVPREGAIYHAFARLGERRYQGLDMELRGIVREQGLREEDPFDMVVARAHFLEVGAEHDFRQITERAAIILARRAGIPADPLRRAFIQEAESGGTPVARGAALPHARAAGVEQTELVMIRSIPGLPAEHGDLKWSEGAVADNGGRPPSVHALFFLLSPEDRPGQHLRILGHLATHIDDDDFLPRWLEAADESALKRVLLQEERSVSLHIEARGPTAELAGRPLSALSLPPHTLVAVVRRAGKSRVPTGDTVLRTDDQLLVIGEADGIRALIVRYGERQTEADPPAGLWTDGTT
jgi:amino acid transporter/mannitol/fructose-specific phosphotransferase system IIA component (Ntr-type)